MKIYNLFPRYAGKIDNWDSHIQRAYDMGFDWIYINPFNYPGFSGSLYSTKDYFKINPLFAPEDDEKGWDSLFDLINRWHGRIGFIADLVINHTAIDSILIDENPNWFKRDNKGAIINPSIVNDGVQTTIWGDLAEVDNENSPDKKKLWDYWKRLINFYIELGFRGFRCDAAYMVPIKLWDFLIKSAKKKSPDQLFLAETLGCDFKDVIKLYKAGFDYSFNSSKYWDFDAPWCLEQYRNSRLFGPSISFAETHDTERLYAEYEGDLAQIKMRILFSALFSSSYMIATGTEYAFTKRCNVVKTNISDWEYTGIDLTDFIRKCNQIKDEYPVFNTECHLQSTMVGERVLCLIRTIFDENNIPVQVGLILINTDNRDPAKAEIHNLADLTGINGRFADISPGEKMEKIRELNFEYWLEPSEIKVFVQNREKLDYLE